MEVIKEVKTRLQAREPVDLTWEMRLEPGARAGMPREARLRFAFDGEQPTIARFNNLAKPEVG